MKRWVNVLQGVGAILFVVTALVFVGNGPRRAEVALASPGDTLEWDRSVCTATEIGEYVWATAAHCLEKAPLELIVRVGQAGIVHVNERHIAAAHTKGDTASDIGIVGSREDVHVRVGSIDSLPADAVIEVHADQPLEGKWVTCTTKKKWAARDGGHWHLQCGLHKGASGSGVWSDGVLVGVISTAEGTWNGVAEASEIVGIVSQTR